MDARLRHDHGTAPPMLSLVSLSPPERRINGSKYSRGQHLYTMPSSHFAARYTYREDDKHPLQRILYHAYPENPASAADGQPLSPWTAEESVNSPKNEQVAASVICGCCGQPINLTES